MTSKDIAKKLGVSTATVSLALNNRPGVSRRTRERILKEAHAGGLIAERKLLKKRKIVFLEYRINGIESKQSYFDQIFSKVVEGAETQCRENNCEIFIHSCDMASFEAEIENLELNQQDGLLVLATEMTESQIMRLEQLHVPIILLDNYCETALLNSVVINNEQGVELAIQYLKEKGHRNIGYIHVDGNAVNFHERYFGFKRSLERHGLDQRQGNIIRFSTLYGGEEVYFQLKNKLRAMDPLPTALLADNDIVALYALRALKEMGLRVPNDISLIGFDNIQAGHFADPPLTTIETDKRNLGACAVNHLVNLMEGQLHGVQKTEIQTKLIERSSVEDISE